MKNFLIIILTLVITQFAYGKGHQHGDAPSVHGMLLFGESEVYVSHLPMFHSPHNYQVIAKVGLSDGAKKIYLNSKKDNPSEIVFTIVPEVFVLPEVMVDGGSFKAKIFAGHFERSGQAITEAVDFEVKEVIYFNQFEAKTFPPEKLTYILFGDSDEMFGAHLISAKPDFDQIVEFEPTKKLTKILNDVPSVIGEYPLSNTNPLELNSSEPFTLKLSNGTNLLMELNIFNIIYTEFGGLSF